MRFVTMNGTDRRPTKEQSRKKRARNATSMRARVHSIVCSALSAPRGILRYVESWSNRRMRRWRPSRWHVERQRLEQINGWMHGLRCRIVTRNHHHLLTIGHRIPRISLLDANCVQSIRYPGCAEFRDGAEGGTQTPGYLINYQTIMHRSLRDLSPTPRCMPC